MQMIFTLLAITPCTAKKFEIMREELSDAANYLDRKPGQDCDRVVTTRELASWMRACNLDLESVEESDYDSLMPRGKRCGALSLENTVRCYGSGDSQRILFSDKKAAAGRSSPAAGWCVV